MRFFLTIFAICAIFSQLAMSQSQAKTKFKNEYLRLEVVPEYQSIAPGEKLRIVFRINHTKHWHTYWINPGGPGLATSVNWQLPKNFDTENFGKIFFPSPKKFNFDGIINYAYEDKLELCTEIQIPENLSPNSKPQNISGNLSWLSCDPQQCVPGNFTFSFPIEITASNGKKDSSVAKAFANLPKNYRIEESPANADWQAFTSMLTNQKKLKLTLKSQTNSRKQNISAIELFPITESIIDDKAPIKAKKTTDNGEIYIEIPLSADIEYAEKQPNFSALIKTKANPKTKGSSFIINTKLLNPDQMPAQQNPEGLIDISPKPAKTSHLDTQKGEIEKKKTEPQFNASSGNVPVEKYSLWIIILSSLLGGLILNLMPCVFPIISIKILSFVKLAGDQRHKVILNSVAYSAGIIFSFIALAFIFIQAKNFFGNQLAWAFQLQSPVFVLAMTALMLVLALNLAGVFELGFIVSSSAKNLEKGAPHKFAILSSFVSGILAVAIATPCTGPFMGGAVAYALASPPIETYLVFISLAVGFALPYLILSVFPGLAKFLPRPGAWMEQFKHLLSIPMFITACWLVWILSRLEPYAYIGCLTALLLVCVAVWMLGTFANPLRSRKSIIVSTSVAVFLMVISFLVAKKTLTPSEITWQDYNKTSFESALANGKPVLMDFTAAWCLTCNTNKVSFQDEDVVKIINKNNIQLFRIDWTKKDQKTLELIEEYGRRSVPLNVYYPQGNSKGYVILPNILTPGILKKYFLQKY